jgi:hypothetical protein
MEKIDQASAEPRLGDDLVRGARGIGEETGETERQVRWRYEAGHYDGVVFKLPGSKMLLAYRSDLRRIHAEAKRAYQRPAKTVAA